MATSPEERARNRELGELFAAHVTPMFTDSTIPEPPISIDALEATREDYHHDNH